MGVKRYTLSCPSPDGFDIEPFDADLLEPTVIVRGSDYDALAARLAEYEEAHRITVGDCGAPDEQHCSCVPSLRLEMKRLQARLAEAEQFIEEIREESAEDFRTSKYVVVQMTTETWEKLKATTDSASPCLHDWQASAFKNKRVAAKTCAKCGLTETVNEVQK